MNVERNIWDLYVFGVPAAETDRQREKRGNRPMHNAVIAAIQRMVAEQCESDYTFI